MIRTEDASLLESAHSAVTGTVDADGLPDAARAWGIWFDGRTDAFRCLLPAGAERTLANLRAGRPIAVCMTHVLDLRSVQVKGRATSVEAATARDLERHREYWQAFAANVHESDGATEAAVRNLTPDAFVAVEVVVESVFDQTPGPLAGAAR